jgi:hypothetical protein
MRRRWWERYEFKERGQALTPGKVGSGRMSRKQGVVWQEAAGCGTTHQAGTYA